MKKIIMFLLCSLIVPSMSFAVSTLGSGTSIADSASTPDHPSSALSLSPNVQISYLYVDADNYAMTGANAKGSMCYGVVTGDQNVYQDETDGVLTAAATDTITGWDKVGQ